MATLTTTRFDSAGMVRINVDFGSYTPKPSTVVITRYSADGTAYTVRGTDSGFLLTLGVGQVDDYEAPLDTDFYYTAVPDTGASLTTPNLNVSSAAAFGVPTAWLKNPGDPSQNVPVMLTGLPRVTYPSQQGIFRVIGRKRAVAVAGVRGGAEMDVTFATLNPASVQPMRGLFAPGQVLLFQPPGSYLWGNWYVIAGDVEEARATRILRDSTRYWSVHLTETDRPTAASMAFSNSFADAQAAYPTFAGMAAVTFATVLAGQDPNAAGSQTFVNPIYGGTVL